MMRWKEPGRLLMLPRRPSLAAIVRRFRSLRPRNMTRSLLDVSGPRHRSTCGAKVRLEGIQLSATHVLQGRCRQLYENFQAPCVAKEMGLTARTYSVTRTRRVHISDDVDAGMSSPRSARLLPRAVPVPEWSPRSRSALDASMRRSHEVEGVS
jgi:hypothetical protein